ncbi:hypothetical protein FJT64_024114 [Amphibalanus amphitrite]|uniref:Uncharacterized protein n=1 Tax=Amphibalanus amphitrite TaxID=1232801 RepID=A0A6A4WMQ1_AMPAM|nr:hypothetical protein FJT64_024114 [Amphibalanus amphitrite]
MDLSMKVPEGAAVSPATNGFSSASPPSRSQSSQGGASPGQVSPSRGEVLSDHSRPASGGGGGGTDSTPTRETPRAAAEPRGHPFPVSRLMAREPAEGVDSTAPAPAPAAGGDPVTSSGGGPTSSGADGPAPVGEYRGMSEMSEM